MFLPTKQATLRCQAFLQQALEKASIVDNLLIERPNNVILNQGNLSDCAKVVFLGKLMVYMQDTDTSEVIRRGDVVESLYWYTEESGSRH